MMGNNDELKGTVGSIQGRRPEGEAAILLERRVPCPRICVGM